MSSLNWRQSVVLITGGTGSFGKRCAEILLRDYHPKKLIIFSRDELKQHEMACGGFDHPSLRYFLGDIRDRERLRRAMRGVDVVIHAAALKQVPACEYNPGEAVKTNVDGAQNIVDAAIDCGVRKVLGLSTDKAVNPINLYGATKLCAEKLLVQGNAYAGAGRHPLQLHALRQRVGQPRQRDPGVPTAAPRRHAYRDRSPHDALLADHRPGRAIRAALPWRSWPAARSSCPSCPA